MDLAKRDILVNSLKTLKKTKEQFLNERSSQLKKQQNTNPHLNHVVTEYNTYLTGLNSEKQKQQNALQGLVNYLNTIIVDPTSTAELIKYAKYDIKCILAEIKSV